MQSDLIQQRLQAAGVDESIACWMSAKCLDRAEVHFSAPLASAVCTGWLGQRIWWWPNGGSQTHRTAVVSSHLGREIEKRRGWFAALRTACINQDPESVLITAEGTTTDRFLRRCSQLFGVGCHSIDLSEGESITKWANRIAQTTDRQCVLYVSPRIDDSSDDIQDVQLRDVPLRDRVLLAISQQVRVLRLRQPGRLNTVLQARLRSHAWTAGSVLLAVGQDLLDSKQALELQTIGAVPWLIEGANNSTPTHFSSPASELTRPETALENEEFLLHCTRHRQGPWPDQSEADYLDDLILDRDGRDHGCLAALCRIINQRRISGSTEATGNNIATVSFTAAELHDLRNMRVYRRHRGRWDFEPYGIAIRKRVAIQRGVRAVIYGTEKDRSDLEESDRPYFQLSSSRSGQDWTVEKEWRGVDDIELSTIAAQDAYVFVPTDEEARIIQQISPWPVVVVPDG